MELAILRLYATVMTMVVIHFSVAYYFDGDFSNGYNHFIYPPSCFKNLTESHGVYNWRLHAQNSSIRGNESPVLEVVAQHALHITDLDQSKARCAI